MQHEVDGYLAQTGGRQVSANRIDFAGGYLVAVVPGERTARDLGYPTRVTILLPYSGQSGTGSVKAWVNCVSTGRPWSGTGSLNDQTTGTHTYFYRYRGAVGADYNDEVIGGMEVTASIQIC